jgi:hypothetical protein
MALLVSYDHNQDSFWKLCFHGNIEYPIIYQSLISVREIDYKFTENYLWEEILNVIYNNR